MQLSNLFFFSQLWLVICGQCDQEDDVECSVCYPELLQQATHHDQNLLNLQTHFFPSEDPQPSFTTVIYHYDQENSTELSNETQEWLWATSSFFLHHPPHIFMFTSLFFSSTDLNYQTLHLNLSHDCYNASNSLMKLVTEKVSHKEITFLVPTHICYISKTTQILIRLFYLICYSSWLVLLVLLCHILYWTELSSAQQWLLLEVFKLSNSRISPGTHTSLFTS